MLKEARWKKFFFKRISKQDSTFFEQLIFRSSIYLNLLERWSTRRIFIFE